MLRAFLALAPLLAWPSSPSDEPAPPLNVLWLTVEDMSPWIGAYGDHTVPTPNLDRLAAAGVVFENAFADSPVCAPARTALLASTYPTRMGAMHHRVRSRVEGSDTPTYEAVPPAHVAPFPELLQVAGWHATNNAKTDYQFRAPAWTWSASGREAHYRNRPDGAPFFAVFNHGGTHESQAFPGARRRPSAVAADAVPVPPFYPDTPAVRDAMKRTYDNIAAMDRWVGERLAELEESGEADNTIVFFFSDHGVGLPRGKRSVYGTGTRVPLIVRFPEGLAPDGLGPGTRSDRLVSFVDLGPTVLSLAGIEPDERLDGRAFLGEHAAAPRRHVFLHADRFDETRDRTRAATDGTRLVVRNLAPELPHVVPNRYRERLPMTADLYALRDGAVRAWARTPAQWQTGSTRRPRVEWYDRRDDPWEVVHLAGAELEAEAAAPFEALERALDAWMADTGDLGLVEDEAAMVREHLWPPDGVQPTTAAPTLDADGRIVCATPGARIGVRDGSRWRPYDGTPVQSGAEVAAIAHRIGYAPSGTATLRR